MTWGAVYVDAAGELTLKITAAVAGTVELFEADSQANGEGERFVSNLIPYSTPGSEQSFNLGLANNLSVGPGDFLVATLTDASNNTSTFSAVVEVAGDPLVAINTNDDGPGSLRAAMEYSLSVAGSNTITFNIPGGGPHTIALASALPVITEAVLINGYSQPGASANTTTGFAPFDANIQIRIDASGIPSGNGIRFTGHSGSEVRGLVIYGAPGAAIDLAGGGHKVKGSFIGSDGINYLGTGGIHLGGGTDDEIGGPNAADRNLIMGGVGQEPGVISPLIQGNYFGLKANGTEIFASGRTTHSISSNQATFVEVRDNVMAGATWRDLSITHANAAQGPRNWSVINNRLGTDYTGAVTLPSGSNGIYVQKGAHDNLIQSNIIAGHSGAGIWIGQGDGDFSPVQNTISRNSMFANGNPGIQLVAHNATGIDANDGILTPVIGSAEITLSGGLNILVTGERVGTIEFFEADTQNEEGQRYFDFTAYGNAGGPTVVAIGNAAAAGIADGDYIVATLTDAAGNTSQFTTAFQVTTEVAPNPLIVTNTADSGLGSLRDAIAAANTTPGTDTITFNLTGGDVYTIAPTSGLPAISESVVFDGLSQTGATCGTTDFTDRALKIVLDGSNIAYAAGGPFGLDIAQNTNGVTIQGLVVRSFPGGGIRIDEGNTGSVIRCNYIGTNESGTLARGNYGSGILLVGSSAVSTGNMIGGPARADGNLISANGGSEIQLEQGADSNTIQNNLIGTTLTGEALLIAPASYFGQPSLDPYSNLVGIGSNQGASNTIRDNVIGGFNAGMELVSQNDGNRNWGGTNEVYGNHIGVARGGAIRLDNFIGVDLQGGGIGSEVIGGAGAGDGNVIRFNYLGVRMGNAQNSEIRQNDIAYNNTGVLMELYGLYGVVANNFIHLNTEDGIQVSNADSGEIRNNTISGNGRDGIFLLNVANSLTIADNYIGVDEDGETPLGNTRNGITILNSSSNVVSGNVVSGNGDFGIVLDDSANLNTVIDNIVGLNAAATTPVPNTGYGISVVNGSHSNQITGNTSSGNLKSGIEFFNAGDGNTATSNFVGTNGTGTAQLGNAWHGLQIGAGGTVQVGGAAAGNTIAYNGDAGIIVYAPDGYALSTANISENSIYENVGLGIDLKLDTGTDGTNSTLNQQNGRNDNDAGDSDQGPNGLTNAPVFNWATLNAGSIDLEVFLDTAVPATVEIFRADASGAEGQTFMGSASATKSGRLMVTVPAGTVQAGDEITATITGPEGTSEFSLAINVGEASAFQLIPQQIVESNVTMLNFTLSADLASIPGMTTAIQNAVQSWVNVSTAEASSVISFAGVSAGNLAPDIMDQVNAITKSTAQFPLSSNTLAVASKLLALPEPGTDEARIVSADIIFNADLIGQAGGIGTDLQNGIWDAQAVATHEFGHTLGLRHSGVSTATMFFSIPSGTSYRSLEADDKAWVSQRYPALSASTFGSISGTITDGESGSNTPVAGALIVARSTNGTRVHAYSDNNGAYTIPGLPADSYTVRIQPLSGLVDNVPGMTPGTVSPYLRSIANNATFTPEMWSGASENTNLEVVDTAETVVVPSSQDVPGVSFTTNLDTTPPVVNGMSPGGTKVSTRPEIAATFSEVITSQNLVFTLTNLGTGQPVAGVGAVAGGTGVVATFTIAAGVQLDFGATYQISITGATDKKGNTNSTPTTQQFTVRPADIVAPVIVTVSPAAGSTGISTNTSFAVTFDETMDTASVTSGLSLECVDVTGTGCPTAAIQGVVSFPTSSQIEGLPGWVALFKPSVDLQESATYRLKVGANVSDVSGNVLGTQASFDFDTQLNVQPTPVTWGPTSSSISVRTSIFADFNERMKLSTLGGTGDVVLTGGPSGTVAGTAELLEDGKRIVFRPDAPLAYMTTYNVLFGASITDASTPPLAIAPLSFTFTTANAPISVQVTSVTPLYAIPGALITLGGSGFSANKTENSVSFSTVGGTVSGVVTSSTLTSLSVIVPDGAIAGPVTVTAGGSSASIVLELYGVLPLVDPAIARTTAESAPRDVEVTPDGGTAYVTNTGSGTVSVFDVQTGAILQSIRVGDSPLKVVLSPDASRLYVSNFGSNTVSVINTNTLTVEKTLEVGLNPFGMAISPDGRRLYVAEYTSQKISIIDLDAESATADRAIARITVESSTRDAEVVPDGGVTIGVESNPRDVEVTPDGGTLFFTTQTIGLRYLVLDANGSADENAATVRITAESSTRDAEVSPDGGVVWVTTMAGALEGYRVPENVDGSYQAVARIGEESNSREVEVSPDGGLLYVTSFDLGLVQIYAISSQIVPSSTSATGSVFALTLEPIRQLSVGDNPEAVVFSAAAQVAIVVNSGSDDVSILSFGEPLNTTPLDTDGDGLTNAEELLLGTNPFLADTDDDGSIDSVDAFPLDGANWTDPDGDGLGSEQGEPDAGTDPMNPDTDGDSLLDGAEVATGTDPLSADTDGDLSLDPDDLAPLDPFEWFAIDGIHDSRQQVVVEINELIAELSSPTVATSLVETDADDEQDDKSKKSSKSSKSSKGDDDSDMEELLEDLAEAAEQLSESFDVTFWLNPISPNYAKGDDILKDDWKAVKTLMHLAKDHSELEEQFTNWSHTIASLDSVATDILMTEATTACGQNKKCVKELNKAKKDFNNALEDMEDGDFDKALQNFEQAWKRAVKLIPGAGKGFEDLADEAIDELLPTEFSLSPNYPNPFNPVTTIEFALPESKAVSLVVYDMLGREVQVLVRGDLNAGYHRVQFNADRLPSGTYLYRLVAGDFTRVQKMVLLK
ncbi:Ig-like domain-containing protein [bacterium]|nr:Ig-like domain-containing protein [bacterium]